MTADPTSLEGDAVDTTPCAIPGCASPAARSLARVEVRKAFPQLSEEGRRASLCRDHYKQYKKSTKVERKLNRIGW
jgi:hypothetical protein